MDIAIIPCKRMAHLPKHIDAVNKNINVACEFVNYTPVAIDDIINMKNLENTVLMLRLIKDAN